MHEQWNWFNDDVVPIAIRFVQIAGEDVDEEGDSAKQVEKGSASCLPQYTSKQLQEKQCQDPHLTKIIKWLDDGYSLTIEELYLSSSTIKWFWLLKNQLFFMNNVLY